METKTIKLRLRSSNIPSNQTSEIKKNFQILYDYAEIWDNYDESNIKIIPPTNQDMVANEELPFRCDLVNVPPEIQELKEDGYLHYFYDWSFTHTNLISDVNAKNPIMVFPNGGENILVKVVVTCEADIGDFEFSKKTASEFIDIKDDIPSLWNKWTVDSSNASDGVIRLTESGNRVEGPVKSSVTYKLIFDIIRIPDEIPKSSLSYYWEADETAVLSSNRDKTPSIIWDKVDKKETKPVNLRVEYADPNSDHYLPFKTLVRHFDIYPNFLVDWWSNWSPSIISPSEIIANTKQPYDVNLNNIAGIDPNNLVYEWSSPDDMVLNNISLKSPNILWKTHGQKTLNVEITHIDEDPAPKFLSKTLDVKVNILDIWNAWNPAIQLTPPVIKDSAVPFTVNPSAPTELDASQLGYQWSSPDGDISRLYNRNTDITFTTAGNGKIAKVNISYPGLPDKNLERIVSVGQSKQDEWNNINPGDFNLSGASSVFVETYSTYTVTNIASALSDTSLNQSDLMFKFISPNSNVSNGKKTSSESDDVQWYHVGITSLTVEISYNGLNGVKSIEKQVDVSKNPENVWGNMLDSDVYINYEADDPFELEIGETKEFVAHVNLPTILNASDLRYEWDFGNTGSWSSPSASNSKDETFPAEEQTTVAVRVSHVNYPGTLKADKDIIVSYSDSQLKNLWDNWNPTMSATPPGPINIGESVDFEVDVSNYPSELNKNKLVYSWSTSNSYVITSQNKNNATMRFEEENPDLVVCTITTTENGLTDKSKELSKQIAVTPSSFDMTINDPGDIETQDLTFTITGTLDHVNNDSSTSAVGNKTITANIVQSTPSLNSTTTTTDSSGNFTFDVSINGFSGDMDFEFYIESSNSPHPYTVPVTGIDNQQLWDNWNPTMIATPPGDISPGTTVNYEVDLSNFPSELDVNNLSYSWVDPVGDGGGTIDFDEISQNGNTRILKLNTPGIDATVRCYVNISTFTGNKDVFTTTTITNTVFDITINDPGNIKTSDSTFTITGVLNHINNDSSTSAVGNKTITANILQSAPSLNSTTTTTDSDGNFSFDVDINGFSGDMDFEFYIESSNNPHPYTVYISELSPYSISAPNYVDFPSWCPSFISAKLDSYDGSSANVGNKVMEIDIYDPFYGNTIDFGQVTTNPNGNFSINFDTYANGTEEEYLDNPDNYIVNYGPYTNNQLVLTAKVQGGDPNNAKNIDITLSHSVTFNMTTSSPDPFYEEIDDVITVNGVLNSVNHDCHNLDESISNRPIIAFLTTINPQSRSDHSRAIREEKIITTDASGNFTVEFDNDGDYFRVGGVNTVYFDLLSTYDNRHITMQYHYHEVDVYYKPGVSVTNTIEKCNTFINDLSSSIEIFEINNIFYETNSNYDPNNVNWTITNLSPSAHDITFGNLTFDGNKASINLNRNNQDPPVIVKFNIEPDIAPEDAFDIELPIHYQANYPYKNVVSADSELIPQSTNFTSPMEITHDNAGIILGVDGYFHYIELDNNLDAVSVETNQINLLEPIGVTINKLHMYDSAEHDFVDSSIYGFSGSEGYLFTHGADRFAIKWKYNTSPFGLTYEEKYVLPYNSQRVFAEHYMIQVDGNYEELRFYAADGLWSPAHTLDLPNEVKGFNDGFNAFIECDYSGKILIVWDKILKIDYDDNFIPISVNYFGELPCRSQVISISNEVNGDSDLRRVITTESNYSARGKPYVYEFSINDPSSVGIINIANDTFNPDSQNDIWYEDGYQCAISQDGTFAAVVGEKQTTGVGAYWTYTKTLASQINIIDMR